MDAETGKRRQVGRSCPQLKRANGKGWSPSHGTWGYTLGITDRQGNRKLQSASGFKTKDEAVAALDALKAKAARGVDITKRVTVAEYIETWLVGKAHELKPNTLAHYRRYADRIWLPSIGNVLLDDLRVRHLNEVFEDRLERNELIKQGKIKARQTGPTAMQRMRAMLRSCLNDALREGLVTVNVAELVKLPSGRAPRAVVWTPPRALAWRAAVAQLVSQGLSDARARHDAQRPSSVMVWTAGQLGQFLDSIGNDRLYALWFVLGTRGLRRGEVLGLRWVDVDWDAATLTIDRQLVNVVGTVMEDKPKSDAGGRVIALGQEGVAVLKAHRTAQARERLALGEVYNATDRIFTTEGGFDLDPSWLTKHFARILLDHDLLPIRLHDVRHTAGSLMIASGSDPKTVQATLGHSDLKLTLGVYVSLYEEVAQTSADAVASFIPRRTKSV